MTVLSIIIGIFLGLSSVLVLIGIAIEEIYLISLGLVFLIWSDVISTEAIKYEIIEKIEKK